MVSGGSAPSGEAGAATNGVYPLPATGGRKRTPEIYCGDMTT